jgi:hypothetical protein
VISGSRVLGEVFNELFVTVKGRCVRSASATKKAVLNQYWPAVSKNLFNGGELLRRSNFLAVARPLIDVRSTTGLEFQFGCHVA